MIGTDVTLGLLNGGRIPGSTRGDWASSPSGSLKVSRMWGHSANRMWGHNAKDARNNERLMLWVDAVGGYWVCLADAVVLGQPSIDRRVDVPILGDVSSRHARIRRDGEGYLIEAIHATRVDGRPVERVAPLGDGSIITLGDSVRLRFRRPHALSATARLDFVSRHRTEPGADAVLLMADSCVLGPKSSSHVVCRLWPHELVLYRHDNELFCRSRADFAVDGAECRGRARIGRNSRITGEQFAVAIE